MTGPLANKRVSVLVPTTAGVIPVVSVRRRPQLPASFVCVHGDYRPIEISAGFDRLVGPGGPLASGRLGFEAGSFEVSLAAPIESGRSWELPLSIACLLVARGAAVVPLNEQPDLVIWATGALDIDLMIVMASYHLKQKLTLTEVALPPGARCLVLLPASDEPTPAAAFGQVVRVSSLAEAVQTLDISTTGPPPGPSPKKARQAMLAACSVLTLVLAGWATLMRPAPAPVAPVSEPSQVKPPKEAKQFPPVEIEEVRAPNGSRCIEVILRNVEPEIYALVAQDGQFPDSENGRVCLLRFRALIAGDLVFGEGYLREVPIAEQTWRAVPGQVVRAPSGQKGRYTITVNDKARKARSVTHGFK